LGANGQSASDVYRVIVLNRDGTEALVVQGGIEYRFPSVEVPCDQRVAENVCAQVRSIWGEEVICFSPDSDSNYQVAEHWRNVGKPSMQTHWAAVETLSRESFVDYVDYEQLQKTIQKVQPATADKTLGPFATLGWFRAVRAWVEMAAQSVGFRLNGDFRQLNASESFSLIRFETNGPALWFKAVGEPNRREFPITTTLAELFPDYLPAILAAHNEWNGWLMQEVEGNALAGAQDLRPWLKAVTALSELQMASIPYSSLIRAAGAHDLAPARLVNLVPDFLETMTRLMSQQMRIPPPVLNRKELGLLGECIQDALVLVQSLDLPDALGHLDLNPWNIIVNAQQCRFLDWAEACVGIPFLSLEYVLEHYRRSPAPTTEGESLLRDEYCRRWEHVISPAAISYALPFLPTLAVFAYAVGDEGWRHPSRLEEPGYAGYLRSLTRRMLREANALAERRSLCPA
jgi:hypothetical protein